MFNNRYERNISMDLGLELVNLNKTIAQQEMIIDELILKGAMYKARFLEIICWQIS